MADPIKRYEPRKITLAYTFMIPYLEKKLKRYPFVRNITIKERSLSYEIESKYVTAIGTEIGHYIDGFIAGFQHANKR